VGRGVGRSLRWAHRLRARARETEVRAHRAGDTTRLETVETADAPTARQKGAMCPAPRNGRVIHLHRVLTVQHPKRKPNTKVSGRECRAVGCASVSRSGDADGSLETGLAVEYVNEKELPFGSTVDGSRRDAKQSRSSFRPGAEENSGQRVPRPKKSRAIMGHGGIKKAEIES
jgi:hypothetical protein